MYDGWLVWDGAYGPVKVGGTFAASIEFVPRTAVVRLDRDRDLAMQHLGENRYQVTARVLEATEAVVLDLGALRVLTWVRPGETATDFTAGTTVALEVNLGLNPWEETPWTTRAIAEHGAEVRLHVKRISLWTSGHNYMTDLPEATTDTVDSAREYCLLECHILD